jgi:hypothetical protein
VNVSFLPPNGILSRKTQINRFLSISHVVLYADDPYFVILIPPMNKTHRLRVKIILYTINNPFASKSLNTPGMLSTTLSSF